MSARLCRTARDSELLHSQLEGGAFHCKMCRRAIRAGHNPIALLESFKNLLTFRFPQNVVKCAIGRFRSRGFFLRRASLGKFKIGNIDAQDRTRRDNHGALDHILKFSYVPRPMIAAQGIHCRRWNRFHDLFHLRRKLLREVPHQQRNICSLTIASRSRFVAAIKRAFVRSVRELPNRSNSLSCSTRSSLVCSSRGISPISSRKIVPPLATSNRPMRCAIAPVNAPFSCPNSSLSSKPVGMAAQFSFTKGFDRRGLKS